MQIHHDFSRSLRSCQKKRWDGSETSLRKLCDMNKFFSLKITFKSFLSKRWWKVPFEILKPPGKRWFSVVSRRSASRSLWRRNACDESQPSADASQRFTSGKYPGQTDARKKSSLRTALNSWVCFEPICKFKLPYECDLSKRHFGIREKMKLDNRKCAKYHKMNKSK